MPKPLPRPPDHLSDAAAAWWCELVESYAFDGSQLRLLQLLCEAWDRSAQARRVLDEHGLTYTDRFGAPRSRPEVAVERDSRLAVARLLRELCLDTADAPRPPALAYGG